MLRHLVAAAAALSPTAALPQSVPSPFFIELANIEKLECAGTTGSGVRIDDSLVVTASHVASAGACRIDGVAVEIVHNDGALDLAVVRTADSAATVTTISCDSFVRGQGYFAVGWAHGQALIVQRVTGTGKLAKIKEFPRQAHLNGLIFPGMSGGAVLDDKGLLVGIVTAGNPAGLTLSRPMNQTYLCGEGA